MGTKKHEQFRRNPKCEWCNENDSVTLILCVLHPVIGVSAISLCASCVEKCFVMGEDSKWKLRKF